MSTGTMGEAVSVPGRSSNGRGRVRAAVTAVVVAIVAVAVAACGRLPFGDGPSPSAAATAVVPTTAPADDTYTCAGLPDSSLRAMLGPDVDIDPRDRPVGVPEASCMILTPSPPDLPFPWSPTLVVYTAFITTYHLDPWDNGDTAGGDTVTTFSFPGVQGSGTAKVDTGKTRQEPLYATTIFVCDDRYLMLAIHDMRVVAGDTRQNLINLTQSALPWLCQGEPIPGLDGRTMDDYRPAEATTTPTPTTSPTP